MRYINSPTALNPVQQQILTDLPATFKSGIVVGAGDGRLVRAIKGKLGKDANVQCIEPRSPLHAYLGDLPGFGHDAWDLNFYKKISDLSGGLDFIIFDTIHEYWTGRIETLRKILSLLKVNGFAWVHFYNSATMYEIGRHLPPLETGYQRLGSYEETWPKMDLSSWMIYLTSAGIRIDYVWGMLQPDAHKFCHSDMKRPQVWEVKGCKVTLKDMGDAYMLGAPVICLKFGWQKPGDNLASTKFLGLQFTASMLQGTLFPYADLLSHELEEFKTAEEILSLQTNPKLLENNYVEFVIKQLTEFKAIKKVLVLGCGWGSTFLQIHKIKPEWELTGVDHSNEKILAAKEALKGQPFKFQHIEMGKPLPFADNAFDLVLAFEYFDTLFEAVGQSMAKDAIRVAKEGLADFEDYRGPEISMRRKAYPLAEVFTEMGYTAIAQPIDINDQSTGYYILKVLKKAVKK